MTSQRRVLAVACVVCSLASAQDWGTSGSWEQIAPSNYGPPGVVYRGATSIAGCFTVLGNDTISFQRPYAYDLVRNVWIEGPEIYFPSTTIADPFTVREGGEGS